MCHTITERYNLLILMDYSHWGGEYRQGMRGKTDK